MIFCLRLRNGHVCKLKMLTSEKKKFKRNSIKNCSLFNRITAGMKNVSRGRKMKIDRVSEKVLLLCHAAVRRNGSTEIVMDVMGKRTFETSF